MPMFGQTPAYFPVLTERIGRFKRKNMGNHPISLHGAPLFSHDDFEDNGASCSARMARASR